MGDKDGVGGTAEVFILRRREKHVEVAQPHHFLDCFRSNRACVLTRWLFWGGGRMGCITWSALDR